MGKLNYLFASIVVFLVSLVVFAPVYVFLVAFGLLDDVDYSTVLVIVVSVGAVLAIPVTAMVRRRLPATVEALLEEEDDAEDDGEDVLADDATPAIFWVNDPDAGSGHLAGADAALAPPPDKSQTKRTAVGSEAPRLRASTPIPRTRPAERRRLGVPWPDGPNGPSQESGRRRGGSPSRASDYSSDYSFAQASNRRRPSATR